MVKKKLKRNQEILFVKLPDPALKDRLRKASLILDRPVAYLVRQAAEQMLDQLAEKHPELKAAA